MLSEAQVIPSESRSNEACCYELTAVLHKLIGQIGKKQYAANLPPPRPLVSCYELTPRGEQHMPTAHVLLRIDGRAVRST
jgi:hypothetical protein